MTEAFFTDLQKEVEKAVVAFRKDLSKIRTGRASTALLEGIMVDYYGASTPLNQLATLFAPSPASSWFNLTTRARSETSRRAS